MRPSLVAALIALAAGGLVWTRARPAGCGLPIVLGTSDGALFLAALDTTPLRSVVWRPGSQSAHRLRLDVTGRLLNSQQGTGRTAWIASVDVDHLLHLYHPDTGGEVVADGTLRPPSDPTAFTWAEDASGANWIFVAFVRNGERGIEAFRRERSAWRSRGSVPAADLRTARAILGERTAVICGAWHFSAAHEPERIAVSGDPDLAEIFPNRHSLIELRLADLTVLTSTDNGEHWRPVPPPWPPHTPFEFQPEAVDLAGSAPLLRWIAAGRLVAARFEHGAWMRKLDVPVAEVHELSGPAVMIGDSLVLIGVCYRMFEEQADSIRVGIVRQGRVEVSTIEVRQ